MGYFPLDVIKELNDHNALTMLLQTFGQAVSKELKKEIALDTDFPEFVLSEEFFQVDYAGKYKDVNDFLLYNKQINNLVLNGIRFNDWHQRRTEWRDLFGEYYVLNEWSKSKMVYKIDGDFFHEVKNTVNLKVSRLMFEHLPVQTMYFDLYDVKGIGDFKGAWVNISGDGTDYILTVYMVTEGTINKDVSHAFFSYYCSFRFNNDEETELDLRDAVSDVTAKFHIDDYRAYNETGEIIRQPLDKADDHRAEIIIAIMQILQFLHAQIDDITESPVTKQTYKPSSIVKNKFSEVRMWDVGVRYGKAIKFAQKQVNEAIKQDAAECVEANKIGKPRKPMRPHIRSAHWQRYHVGEGRKQIKINWIPPTYVCGGREIAVTIHKVS